MFKIVIKNQNNCKYCDVRGYTDYRKFWKTVKRAPSNKTRRDEKIVLVENEEILSNNIDIAKTLHNFFSNVIKFLCNPQIDYESLVDEIADPSILTIWEKCLSNKYFTFLHTNDEKSSKRLINLMPARIIKKMIFPPK